MFKKTIGGIAAAVAVAALLSCGPGGGPPVINGLSAMPDSMPRGGVATLKCAAEDPDRGELAFRWQAVRGTMLPDTGDSVTYLAPDFDTWDTVFVTVTDDQDERIDSSLVIYVAEGFCGGLPEVLVPSRATMLYADRDTVYYVDRSTDGFEIRWVTVDGLDYDTLLRWNHDILDLDGSPDHLYFLDRDISGGEPRYRVQRLDKTGGAPVAVVNFGGRDSAVVDISVSATDVLVAWYETTGDTVAVGRLAAFPLAGGARVELAAVTAPRSDETVISRPVGAGGSVFFLVSSLDPGQVMVGKVNRSTRALDTLASAAFLAPGTLASNDWLDSDDGVVYWSEQAAGRIGAVGADGTNPRFIVAPGGAAAGVTHLVAAQGFANTGTRLFWTVPDDLRGLVVPTGDLLLDMDQAFGTFRCLGRNDDFLFFVLDDGGSSRLWRELMP